MKLTARPAAPLFVRTAILGSLVVSPLGCGGDDGTGDSANSTDVAPTAGPCVHADGSNLPECASTGGGDGGDASGTTGTMSTSGAPTTTDQAPTAGPCVHADGSQLPECQADSSGTATTDASSGSGSESGSDSGSDSGSSGG